MTKGRQFQCVLEKHLHEHAGNSQEGRIAERQESADRGLEHRTLGSGRVKVDRHRSHHVFSILMAQHGRDRGDKSCQRSDQIRKTVLQDSNTRFRPNKLICLRPFITYTPREGVEVALIMLDLVCEEPAPFLIVVRRGVSEVDEAFQALACFWEDKCSLTELHRRLVSSKSKTASTYRWARTSGAAGSSRWHLSGFTYFAGT